MKRKNHICTESKSCCCSSYALEPNENCPYHAGGDPIPRCDCGRFVKRKLYAPPNPDFVETFDDTRSHT